mmetsp:Transcript_23902/g.37484  ORF Transcript_23902/g.37484 Transcript_23902/m.37484 type:complete len:218 (-) Transcript_23902:110-763(-)
MWLNNCVGDLNYRAFAMSIISVAVMTGIVLHICIYLLVDCLAAEESFEKRLDDNHIFGGLSREAALGILCAMICVNLPLFFLDMQLILLHVFLTWHQLTTYEYIMEKRTVEALEGDDVGVSDPSQQKDRRLPDCFDWIVYKRRAKRHKPSSDMIEVIDPCQDTKSPPSETASDTNTSTGQRRHVDTLPTPPGTTSEAGGLPEHLTSMPASQTGRAES